MLTCANILHRLRVFLPCSFRSSIVAPIAMPPIPNFITQLNFLFTVTIFMHDSSTITPVIYTIVCPSLSTCPFFVTFTNRPVLVRLALCPVLHTKYSFVHKSLTFFVGTKNVTVLHHHDFVEFSFESPFGYGIDEKRTRNHKKKP